VSLDDQLYATNPLTRQWLCFEQGSLFDPVVLFDEERGLDYLISEELTDVELVGVEEYGEPERPHYHLTGTMPGEPLQEISFGLLGKGPVEAEVWADTETLLVSQLVLTDTDPETDETTTWTMTIDNYNADMDIRAPVEC
jgi:lipoprotein LprG